MTRVLLAYSDTGGGHRAAASAIRDALTAISRSVQATMVDPYAMSDRWPFDRLAAAYPRVVDNASWLWRSGFRLTNTTQCTATLQAIAWPALRPTFRAIKRAESPDVIVCTHSLLTTPLRHVFPGTPLVVVVTDLVSGHKSWYNHRADLLVAPTAAARASAVACGVDDARIEVLGLPVAPGFARTPHDAALQVTLGWSGHQPTVLMVGGGDGVGPLEVNALAIDASDLPCDLAIVCGRNAALAARLRARSWRRTVHVYDFVANLDAMMRAATVLVTKAGPGTICEAFAAGCPIVLTSAIPGQETGNVRLVCAGGAGMWAPSAERVCRALAAWLDGVAAADARTRAAEAALRMARPTAAKDIALRVLQMAWQPRPRHGSPNIVARPSRRGRLQAALRPLGELG